MSLARSFGCHSLCVILASPARAQAKSLSSLGRNIVIGIVAVAAAVVVITVVVVHESTKKRTITGCINSGENGMSVTDEKDKRIYALSGNTSGVKSGDRATLHGKKVNPNGVSKSLTWEINKETKNFGACQPWMRCRRGGLAGGPPAHISNRIE
jgi:hypothetical protein